MKFRITIFLMGLLFIAAPPVCSEVDMKSGDIALSKAKTLIMDYYRLKGEWAGIYVIDSIEKIELSSLRGNQRMANVKYRYKPVPRNNSQKSSGYDQRTFTLEYFNGRYKVTNMGRHGSTVIVDSEPDVLPENRTNEKHSEQGLSHVIQEINSRQEEGKEQYIAQQREDSNSVRSVGLTLFCIIVLTILAFKIMSKFNKNYTKKQLSDNAVKHHFENIHQAEEESLSIYVPKALAYYDLRIPMGEYIVTPPICFNDGDENKVLVNHVPPEGHCQMILKSIFITWINQGQIRIIRAICEDGTKSNWASEFVQYQNKSTQAHVANTDGILSPTGCDDHAVNNNLGVISMQKADVDSVIHKQHGALGLEIAKGIQVSLDTGDVSIGNKDHSVSTDGTIGAKVGDCTVRTDGSISTRIGNGFVATCEESDEAGFLTEGREVNISTNICGLNISTKSSIKNRFAPEAHELGDLFENSKTDKEDTSFFGLEKSKEKDKGPFGW